MKWFLREEALGCIEPMAACTQEEAIAEARAYLASLPEHADPEQPQPVVGIACVANGNDPDYDPYTDRNLDWIYIQKER